MDYLSGGAAQTRKEDGERFEQKQYIARKIKYQNLILVNICDEELLGSTVKGEKVDMHISREYFGGEKVNEIEAIDLVRGSSIVNLAGSRIVEKVIDANLASKHAVKNVGSVSFLMIYKFTN
ncbi:MAG TPA: DUF424 family protein [Nitrososphaerales archaeon]|nr:DUF424 family protein [Nitrososphaerales archaeon]